MTGGGSMALTRYALDDFIHEMTDLVSARPDQTTLFDRGARLIERLVRDPESVPERYRRPAVGGRPPGGGGHPPHRGAGRSGPSGVWGPGAHVGPHDQCTRGGSGGNGKSNHAPPRRP